MTGPLSAYIEAMAKHLPPSGALLRLLDSGGQTGAALRHLRPDLEIALTAEDEASVDAITALDLPLDSAWLAGALRLLRPGGRLIIVQMQGAPSSDQVATLEQAGYVRILVEPALETGGVLIRGEKAHTTEDTLARIRVAAERDDGYADLAHYPGRFVHVLIRQSPNKPAWALREGEAIEWRAAALDRGEASALIAFSSLSKAVAFMQPAVLAGRIRDIHKVGKFSVQTAQTWGLPLLLNPSDTLLIDAALTFFAVDPASAERPDE
jgi:hypothetical protein